MKKGHQLKLGFLFVQNVLKGFDYDVKSFSCSRYTRQKKKKKKNIQKKNLRNGLKTTKIIAKSITKVLQAT